MEFSSNLSAIYTKWCADFSADFWTFRIFFDFNFLKIVAPPSDRNKNCLAVLKGQSLLKKGWKRNENQPINSDTIAVQSISHSHKQPAQIGSINKKNKHHIFARTAGAHCTIYPKLCMAIELVQTIKKGVKSLFGPMRSFSYRLHEKFWPNWPTHGFSTTFVEISTTDWCVCDAPSWLNMRSSTRSHYVQFKVCRSVDARQLN